jgi:centromere protein V
LNPDRGGGGEQAIMITHRGGCHCGRVRFEVIAPATLQASECNCSICAKSGFLGLVVPKARFRLLSGADCLTTYSFNTGIARHLFCSRCGIKSFYVPRSHPEGYNVNVRCLDPGTVESLTIRPFNGLEWERQYPSGHGAPLE